MDLAFSPAAGPAGLQHERGARMWLYWAAMFAASALGTNLGDFWAEGLDLGLLASFGSIAVLTLAAIAIHRWWGGMSLAGYWVAIVFLRAGATNIADYLTHDLRLGFAALTITFAAATLAAGAFTRPAQHGIPVIDMRYWAAMFVAGLFGTVGGDWAAHLYGLGAAAAGLAAILALALALRPTAASVPGYWIIVLAERCAGTPAGDGLASRHGFGLGLPVAMLCTGGALMMALAVQSSVWSPAASKAKPSAGATEK